MNAGDISKTDRSGLLLYIQLVLSYPDFKHAHRAAQYLFDQKPRLKLGYTAVSARSFGRQIGCGNSPRLAC